MYTDLALCVGRLLDFGSFMNIFLTIKRISPVHTVIKIQVTYIHIFCTHLNSFVPLPPIPTSLSGINCVIIFYIV